jgi:hypothetical protein
MEEPGPYTAHLDTLIALITHLSLTANESRTPPWIAADLALDLGEVRATFGAFPGIFRRSQRRSRENGEYFYTVHARYALRRKGAVDDEPLPEMRPEIMKALLDLVSQRAAAEAEERRFALELAHTSRNARIAALAACAAAVLAAVAAVIAAVVG